MKADRPDFADRTVVMYPRPPRPGFHPTSSTVRMVNAPIRPRPPERSPSVPALTVDADSSLEIEVAAARFRRGRMPWAVIGGALLVAAALVSMAVIGHGAPHPVKAAAAGGGSAETQLERERMMRSARAQGQWVEMEDPPKPCDDPARAAPGAPCPPKPTP
jgi:hypothetical protein